MPLVPGLQVIGIIDRDRHPQTAAFVPVHGDGLAAQLVLGGKQFQFEIGRMNHVLLRFGRLQWFLHQAECFALSLLVIRNAFAHVDILKRLEIPCDFRQGRTIGKGWHDARVSVDSPANAAFDEVLETRVAPGPLIVSPGGVENPTLALRTDPGPGFLVSLLFADFQNDAILFVVFGMDVGFIPALEPLKPLHDGMIGLGDHGAERPGAMPLELPTHQGNDLGRVAKTVRGTVQRNESLAIFHVFQQGFLLLGGKGVDVGVNDQAIVGSQDFGCEGFDLVGIGQINAACCQDRLQLPKALRRPMMSIVSQEEEFQVFGLFRDNKPTAEEKTTTGKKATLQHGETPP